MASRQHSRGCTHHGLVSCISVIVHRLIHSHSATDNFSTAHRWDYGYQITGIGEFYTSVVVDIICDHFHLTYQSVMLIANRTTIADGNTWNHEHIALLGKALTGTEEEGYQIARHLADYVLVWGGGGGDDLAKSPHLARIANSVYRDHCPGDVTCRAFGFVVRS